MKLRKGWAIVDGLEPDPRKEPEKFWAFDVYRTRAAASHCLSAGEKVVRVEYRFPEKRDSLPARPKFGSR
jgi:hypothetical protein